MVPVPAENRIRLKEQGCFGGWGGGCSFSSSIFCADSVWRQETNSTLGVPRTSSAEAPGGRGSRQGPGQGELRPRRGGERNSPGTEPATGGQGASPAPHPLLLCVSCWSRPLARPWIAKVQGAQQLRPEGSPPGQALGRRTGTDRRGKRKTPAQRSLANSHGRKHGNFLKMWCKRNLEISPNDCLNLRELQNCQGCRGSLHN